MVFFNRRLFLSKLVAVVVGMVNKCMGRISAAKANIPENNHMWITDVNKCGQVSNINVDKLISQKDIQLYTFGSGKYPLKNKEFILTRDRGGNEFVECQTEVVGRFAEGTGFF